MGDGAEGGCGHAAKISMFQLGGRLSYVSNISAQERRWFTQRVRRRGDAVLVKSLWSLSDTK